MHPFFIILAKEYRLAITSRPFLFVTFALPLIGYLLVRALPLNVEVWLAEETQSVGTIGEEDARLIQALSTSLVFYGFLMVYGTRAMHTIAEEKVGRVSEMLLAVVSPRPLLLGHLCSSLLVGLTQLTVYSLMLFGFTREKEWTCSWGSPTHTAVCLLCFFLGYFLYSSLLASYTAKITHQRDTTVAVAIAGSLLIAAFYLSWMVYQEALPALFGYVLTLCPFSSPIAVPMLFEKGIPPFLMAGSLAILLVSASLSLAFACYVFRRSFTYIASR